MTSSSFAQPDPQPNTYLLVKSHLRLISPSFVNIPIFCEQMFGTSWPDERLVLCVGSHETLPTLVATLLGSKGKDSNHYSHGGRSSGFDAPSLLASGSNRFPKAPFPPSMLHEPRRTRKVSVDACFLSHDLQRQFECECSPLIGFVFAMKCLASTFSVLLQRPESTGVQKPRRSSSGFFAAGCETPDSVDMPIYLLRKGALV